MFHVCMLLFRGWERMYTIYSFNCSKKLLIQWSPRWKTAPSAVTGWSLVGVRFISGAKCAKKYYLVQQVAVTYDKSVLQQGIFHRRDHCIFKWIIINLYKHGFGVTLAIAIYFSSGKNWPQRDGLSISIYSLECQELALEGCTFHVYLFS